MNQLFTYGTIAQKEVQLEIVGRECAKVPALLEGYEVCQGKWAYFVPKPGSLVAGWLIKDLSNEDIARFDEYEEAKELTDSHIYDRRLDEVRLQDGSFVTTWVYFPVLEKWPAEWLKSA
jgi:gamma-glutamylcyclotransferase (GGCT)/AIG2-like uncharacterized protein YtfP